MSRRTTAVILVLLGVGALLTAGAPLLEVLFARQAIETAQVDGDVVSIVIETRNGDITVVGDPDADVRLETRWSFAEPTPEITIEDGVLTVRDGCPDDRFLGSCQVDIVVRAPSTATVTALAINGDVRLDLRDGPVRARSTNGAIELRRSLAPDVDLTTVNGSITVSLLVPPARVAVETTNGGIEISVPHDTYAVEARTQNGSVLVDLPTDPLAERRISAISINGPVRVLALR